MVDWALFVMFIKFMNFKRNSSQSFQIWWLINGMEVMKKMHNFSQLCLKLCLTL